MSNYFKTGTELGKPNGFIKRVMRCKSYKEIYEWWKITPRQDIIDDMNYYRDKYDLNDEKYKTVKQIIDKIEEMIA